MLQLPCPASPAPSRNRRGHKLGFLPRYTFGSSFALAIPALTHGALALTRARGPAAPGSDGRPQIFAAPISSYETRSDRFDAISALPFGPVKSVIGTQQQCIQRLGFAKAHGYAGTDRGANGGVVELECF